MKPKAPEKAKVSNTADKAKTKAISKLASKAEEEEKKSTASAKAEKATTAKPVEPAEKILLFIQEGRLFEIVRFVCLGFEGVPAHLPPLAAGFRVSANGLLHDRGDDGRTPDRMKRRIVKFAQVCHLLA